MNHQSLDRSNKEELASLFASAFSHSEGEEEGALIGSLTAMLASSIDNQHTICFGARENDLLVGSIFFTRLQYNDPIQVYMLAPVAVSPDSQGKGIGQALINHGLDELRKRAVSVVVTYGDPSFYSKVGFQPISVDLLQAPFTLSMPFGWLGQSLTDEPIPSIKGRPVCVEGFNDPVYW